MLPIRHVVFELRFVSSIGKSPFIEVVERDRCPGRRMELYARADRVEPRIPFREGVVIEPQSVPADESGSPSVVQFPFKLRSPRVRDHTLFSAS